VDRGPLLVLQTYSPEVLSVVASRLQPDTLVTVLFHLGLADQRLVELRARELASFHEADHLTSLWIDGIRGPGEAMEDLVNFTRRLRAECPGTKSKPTLLSRAIYSRSPTRPSTHSRPSPAPRIKARSMTGFVSHFEEELGDLLFQIVFHAELGDEEELFQLRHHR